MSDLRLTAGCSDCSWWNSGTSTLPRTEKHIDLNPDHRVTITRSGELGRDMS